MSNRPNLNLPVFNSFAPTAIFLAENSGRDILVKTVQRTPGKVRHGRRLLCVVKSVSYRGTGLVPLYGDPRWEGVSYERGTPVLT